MDDETGLLVRELLPERFENIEQTIKDGFSSSAEQTPTGLTSFVWQTVGRQATASVHELLNFDILELLARGWCLAQEIEEQSDQAKHQKRKVTVTVGEHKFPVELHPVLAITMGPYKARPLRFTLELAATVHAVALSIRAGHIVGIAAGDYEISAQLKYGNMKMHPKEIKSKRRQISREYKFKEPGILIGRRSKQQGE